MPDQPSLTTFTPSESYQSALERACEIWGIQKSYWDIFGKYHAATPEVLATILKSMGIRTESRESIDSAVEARLWNQWSQPVAPTLVRSLSGREIPVQLPESFTGEVTLRFRWEHGSFEEFRVSPETLRQEVRAELRGIRFIRYLIPLPAGAQCGYHHVTVQAGEQIADCGLILCPDRAYQPPFMHSGSKRAGIAISLYGLRSGRNWGCGDFTDLKAFTDWASDELQVSFIALNPLHSIPNRQPYNTSPYLPNCSYYRNALYLDPERIEDLRHSRCGQRLLGSELVQSRIRELRASQYVEYEKVWRLKLTFLKIAFREFLRSSPRRQEFEDWHNKEGELLHKFAIYQTLDEVFHKQDANCWIWPDWRAEFRDSESEAVRAFAAEHWRRILFYKYVQWQVDRQLAEAQQHTRDHGLSIGLYHDLALATDRCGSDLWGHPAFYVTGCRVGSPPDDFSPDGQDWAFPPPNSAHHHDTGYKLFVESIRKNCRHGGALRIDHVMRFFRLFWIPDGKAASDGAYVHDYSDDLIRILALESVRNQVIVIGEDLGTVEPYIREALNRYGILSYRLLYFEKNKDETFRLPGEYPRQALASVSTHDLPTLAGFWLGRDIEARHHAGVIDDAAYRAQLRSRADEKQRMLDVFFQLELLPQGVSRNVGESPDFTGDLHNAAVGFLAVTPSELMLLNQEDLFRDTDQQNLPGTTAQYPNWRHKMRYSLEQLETDEQARACAFMFRSWLSRTGRLNQS